MGHALENYSLLSDQEDAGDSDDLHPQTGNSPPNVLRIITIIVAHLLSLSVIFNIFLLTRAPPAANATQDCASKGLSKFVDQSHPFVGSSNYSSSNFTLTDQLWDAIDFDAGLVALPNKWTASKGLPDSARFPWDQEKSIWLLNGYHNLHCVKRIYISLMEYREGYSQSLPPSHIYHCLDSLRDQTLCEADDTPRTIHYRTDKGHFTGPGQHRRCKDWSKLEAWAKENSACYRYGDPTYDAKSQYERYVYCPKNSPYLPIIRDFFGKDDQWYPAEDSV